MNRFKTSFLVISLGLTLTACGGGSDGASSSTGNGASSSTGNSGTTPDTSTGSVLEKLNPSQSYNIIFDYPNSSGASRLDSVKQNADGIITEFGDYKITGDIVAKEIAGNKNFTIARVTKGIFNYEKNGEIKSTDISKYSNASYFYFAFTPIITKRISAQTKQINCTDVNATQAKVTNSGQFEKFISPSIHNGSITLNPNGNIDVKFTAKNGSDETTFASSMRWVDSFNNYSSYNLLGIVGQQGESNQIGTFNIADNGPNSLVLGAIYRMTLSNNGNYQGAVSMVCNY